MLFLTTQSLCPVKKSTSTNTPSEGAIASFIPESSSSYVLIAMTPVKEKPTPPPALSTETNAEVWPRSASVFFKNRRNKPWLLPPSPPAVAKEYLSQLAEYYRELVEDHQLARGYWWVYTVTDRPSHPQLINPRSKLPVTRQVPVSHPRW